MFKYKRPTGQLPPREKPKYASNRRLTDEDVREIRRSYQLGNTKVNLSRIYGVVPTAITYVLTGQSYSWVK